MNIFGKQESQVALDCSPEFCLKLLTYICTLYHIYGNWPHILVTPGGKSNFGTGAKIGENLNKFKRGTQGDATYQIVLDIVSLYKRVNNLALMD